MKYTVVLNGCSGDTRAMAEELHGFLAAYGAGPGGRTVLFYRDEEKREELVRCAPTEKVILVKVDGYLAEDFLPILKVLADDSDLYLFTGEVGGELAVRLAYRLGGSSLVGASYAAGAAVFGKAVYSGHLQGEFSLEKKPYCVVLARGMRPLPIPDLQRVVQKVEFEAGGQPGEFIPAETGEGLSHARFVLVAGRGVNGKENAAWVEEAARRLGAEFAVTRPVAMSGWAPLQRLVGVSGAVIGPEVCLVVGASGAAAFYAGIEKSDLIVAINIDGQAPITRLADVVLVDDYRAVLAGLLEIEGVG
ncbi:MAG TPA: electron transfer flavoprotein subunit alpha/FixB family protein [Clostridia bacterium]|nr:electron transfer flavoprotein subunit alpha/FixB family protein [Clostridia bacterium]